MKRKTHREMFLEAFESEGPMTAVEMAVHIGCSDTRASNTLANMRRKSDKFPQQIYVLSWTREVTAGRRFYLRAVFALGAKKDAEKPPALTQSEKAQRVRQRKLALVNSVFALAIHDRASSRRIIPKSLKI